MYFQLFIRKSGGKLSQHSIDNMDELNEFVEQRKPKFFFIKAYDEEGLRVINHYYWNFMQDRPIRYSRTFTRQKPETIHEGR